MTDKENDNEALVIIEDEDDEGPINSLEHLLVINEKFGTEKDINNKFNLYTYLSVIYKIAPSKEDEEIEGEIREALDDLEGNFTVKIAITDGNKENSLNLKAIISRIEKTRKMIISLFNKTFASLRRDINKDGNVEKLQKQSIEIMVEIKKAGGNVSLFANDQSIADHMAYLKDLRDKSIEITTDPELLERKDIFRGEGAQ